MNKVKNTYAIYLKFGSKKFKIPVNPQEIEVKYDSNNKEYDVLGAGQIVVPGKPKLKTISWESFFPNSDSASYVEGGIKQPETYVKQIEKAMKSKQIVRVIISRSKLYDTNMRCLISNFTTTDKGGEPGDMYYSVELQEYKSYAPKVISVVTTPAATDPGTQEAEADGQTDRPAETPVLRVGAACIANGKYWYDSYGSKPFGTASNLSTTVTRIAEGNPYPVHIGTRGWLAADQLQITG